MKKTKQKKSIIETIGKKIPDPVIIFMGLFVTTMLITLFIGGKSFNPTPEEQRSASVTGGKVVIENGVLLEDGKTIELNGHKIKIEKVDSTEKDVPVITEDGKSVMVQAGTPKIIEQDNKVIVEGGKVTVPNSKVSEDGTQILVDDSVIAVSEGKAIVDGTYTIKNMFEPVNMRWIMDNALLKNWLSYGGGVLGTILVVMLGVGLAEESGLLSALIKKVGLKVSDRYLPFVLVFIGIMSSVATDAGYVILIPLAGLLYAGLRKNPLIGMAAAFAGVSAGFSANLIPATPSDIILGTNAKAFAEAQGIPFLTTAGKVITPATMHYIFIVTSTLLLTVVGGFITIKVIKPRLEKEDFIIPEDMNLDEFTVKPEENKALIWAGLGLLVAAGIVALLGFGPLASYTNAKGETVRPLVDNIILVITFLFLVPGLFYGARVGVFKKSADVVKAMSKSMSSMGSIIVLTFFSYNFLALLSESQLGSYITYLGATALQNLGLAEYPILLLIGFIITTAIINLFVGGMTSKWMLLGPIFIPMLYNVNNAMTPDMVAAAYRVADSSTNIITPLMSYAGLILVFMRKYKPEYSVGDLVSLMFPYSISFLAIWTTVLIGFFTFGIPLGF